MTLKNGLIAVAVIAAVGFIVCLFGGVGIDGTSKARDADITERVEKVESNVALAKGDKGDQGKQGQTGKDGASGKDGLACYDMNGNGVGDVEEDMNGDGEYDTLDCRGMDGAIGAVGPQGPRGKPGFGLKIRIGGRDGKPGKDCVGGGECQFTAVCCNDDKPSTATVEPTKPTKPEPAKKPEKKNKKQKTVVVDDEPRVMFQNEHTVTVRVNGRLVERSGGSAEPTPPAALPSEVKNEGGTVYINNAPVNVRIGN